MGGGSVGEGRDEIGRKQMRGVREFEKREVTRRCHSNCLGFG